MEKITVLILLLAAFHRCTSSYSLSTATAGRINDQIHLEKEASFFYHGYAHFFESSNVSLPGFSKFFSAMSWEKKGHADKLMTFMNKRLSKIVSKIIDMNKYCGYFTHPSLCKYVFRAPVSCPSAICNNDLPLRAMEDALQLEKWVFSHLNSIVSKTRDPDAKHFLGHEYFDEQVDSIKEISDYVTHLRRFNSNPMGTFMMDERFQKGGKPAKKRLKKITAINLEATQWSELINLSQSGVCEPALTGEFSDYELQESLMNNTKLELPDPPAHSQSVERAVKLTFEASHTVYGLEARHKHILAKALCHQIMPSFASKGSYTEHFDDIMV